MTDENHVDVFAIIEQSGSIGLAMKLLQDSTVTTTKKNYLDVKNLLLEFPEGRVDAVTIKQYLEQVLDKEELIFVLFKKTKRNGKVGHKKGFKKGFSFYIGVDPNCLFKLYAHWHEEKRFLLDNIDGLGNQVFYITTSAIDCIPDIFSLDIHLFNQDEKTLLEAKICLCAGYKA